MANAFVEPTTNGAYQVEFTDRTKSEGPFDTQEEAIAKAKAMGYHPLVARVRHLNDKANPNYWRSAD